MNRGFRYTTIVLGCCTIAVTAFTLYRRDPAAKIERAVAAVTPTPVTVAEEYMVASISKALLARRPASASPDSNEAKPVDAQDETDGFEAPPLTPEQKAQAELHRKTDPYFWESAPSVLETMWKEQKVDSSWTGSISNEAAAMLKDAQYEGTSLKSVDCRDALCRIEFNHRDLDSATRFKSSEMSRKSWISGAGNALGGLKTDKKGKTSTYIIFTKQEDHDTFLKVRERIASENGLSGAS